MSVYLGLIVADPGVEQKLREKHGGLTLDDVRDAIQQPSRSQAGWDDDEEYGRRLIAVGTTSSGRAVIAVLLPHPPYDGDDAETWIVKTAQWLEV